MTVAIQMAMEIQAVEPIGDCVLRLRFSDGRTVAVDFGPFLRNSQHPDIRKYLDGQLFKSYRLEDGDLMWGDFDLCFPIADLYEGRI